MGYYKAFYQPHSLHGSSKVQSRPACNVWDQGEGRSLESPGGARFPPLIQKSSVMSLNHDDEECKCTGVVG